MKNIVLEELNRVKLLMSYDSKNTLSENIEIIKLVESKKIISEQGSKTFLKAILGTSDEAAALALKTTRNLKYTAGVTLFNDVKIYGKTGLSSGDGVMTALINNTLTKAQLSELAKGLMKTGKATGSLRTTLTNKAADMAVKDVKYANMTQTQVSKSLVKKGYDPAIADEIAAKFANKKGLSNISPVKGGNTPTINSNIPISPQTVPKWLKGALYVAGPGATLGTIYLAWKTFFGEDDDLPPCIKPLVTNVVEFEKYLKNEYVTMGKYTIYRDKKVKYKMATGEELIGEWSYNTETQTIDADFNGKIVNVPCAPGAENPEKNTEPEKNLESQKSRYIVCPGFPYKLYCKSEDIRKVQQCLGGDVKADSYLGPKTEEALKKSGYSLPLTKEVYNKIIANCGNSQTSIAQNMELNLPTPEDDLNSLNPY